MSANAMSEDHAPWPGVEISMVQNIQGASRRKRAQEVCQLRARYAEDLAAWASNEVVRDAFRRMAGLWQDAANALAEQQPPKIV